MVKENQKCIPEMKVCVYKTMVYTGDVDGAGTDGNVMVQLIGEKGASKEQYPDSARNDFERGAADPFFLELTPLGTLTEAKVNRTSQKPWFLEKIVVKKVNFPETYTFHYNNWVNGMVRILASSE
ncbi:lipoxygenase homology domain-containing protein 1-like [Haliotis rubra]|uniref:lipoxygenase homology domain-containing protein 1-like n=1 Tax=Haliotis rubra TaxID=36100 RepID=UPI001EE5CD3C|nr:lipoxygenase homology domain-containing protein 1-like [Haliotis rubra]